MTDKRASELLSENLTAIYGYAFSKLYDKDIIQEAMNRYLNGLLTNEQVIEELLNLAKQIQQAKDEGDELGLTPDELAF